MKLLLLLLFNTAQAGVGLTSHISKTRAVVQSGKSIEWLPTIDYVTESLILQIKLLETIASLPQQNVVQLGINSYYQIQQEAISPAANGVLYLGLSLDFMQNNTIKNNEFTEAWVLFQPRMGIELVDSYGAGIFITPSLGWARVPKGETDIAIINDLVIGGGLQLSVWRE